MGPPGGFGQPPPFESMDGNPPPGFGFMTPVSNDPVLTPLATKLLSVFCPCAQKATTQKPTVTKNGVTKSCANPCIASGACSSTLSLPSLARCLTCVTTCLKPETKCPLNCQKDGKCPPQMEASTPTPVKVKKLTWTSSSCTTCLKKCPALQTTTSAPQKSTAGPSFMMGGPGGRLGPSAMGGPGGYMGSSFMMGGKGGFPPGTQTACTNNQVACTMEMQLLGSCRLGSCVAKNTPTCCMCPTETETSAETWQQQGASQTATMVQNLLQEMLQAIDNNPLTWLLTDIAAPSLSTPPPVNGWMGLGVGPV
jgi:hypothetical protein